MPHLYKEIFRPKIHFSPPQNFMNDPNGLIYYKGNYHLFYQFNPHGMKWGHVSWGHAVSHDLIHWDNLPIAIPEENNMMIFSGSAVQDKNNSSGLGSETENLLCAIYTGNHKEENRQTQNLAYSIDAGYTWVKYKNNPILDISTEHFRDPKVFWYNPSKMWIMVVTLANKKIIHFYSSKNLLNWVYLSKFGPAGKRDTTYWECPDLIELPIRGSSRAKKWILKVDVIDNAIAGGSGSQYFIGHFDGSTFLNDNPTDEVLWVDYGKDFYAAQTINNLPDKESRTIWLAWMNNWQYANDIPTHPWRGNMTIPREVHLTSTPDGLRLCQLPIREIQFLRKKLLELKSIVITPEQEPLNQFNPHITLFEVIAEFSTATAKQFGLKIREYQDNYTIIGYDADEKKLFLDRRFSGFIDFHPDFPGIHYAPLDLLGQKRLKLQIIVDAICVEVFAQEGARVITDLIFPNQKCTGISLFTEGGFTNLLSLKINTLQ